MPNRTALVGLLAAAALTGCRDPSEPSSPAAAPVADAAAHDGGAGKVDVRIGQRPLDAEALAAVLGVEAWRFRYTGGPVRCWLEVEEVGRDTLPDRLPHEDLVGDEDEGEILLSWHPLASGWTTVRIACGNSGHSQQLDADAFTGGGSGRLLQEGGTHQGRETPLHEARPGEEATLMTYEFRSRDAGGGEHRRVTLRLKAARAEPKE